MGSFLEGVKFAIGILFVFGIVGLVYASGWHIPSEILGGTFGANTYVFNGSTVDFTGATVLGVATESGSSGNDSSYRRYSKLNVSSIFPDAIICQFSGNFYLLTLEFRIPSGNVGYTGTGGASSVWNVVFSSTGDYVSTSGFGSYDCTSKNISTLIEENKTVNLGGGGTTTITNVENGTYLPAGSVMPFNLTSCPTGWADYEPAYGRFVRGIDKSGTNIDPDGERALGSIQDDAFESHTHSGWGQQRGTSAGTERIAYYDSGTGSQSNVVSETGGDETRPKNVALLYCIKTGGSSASTTGGVQSAFSVHRNGVDWTSIPSSTYQKIDWTTEDFDINSEFNLTADAFYPKVAGKYILTAGVSVYSMASGTGAFIGIYKNGVLHKWGSYNPGSGGSSYSSVSAVIDAVSGDNFTAIVWHNHGSVRTVGGGKSNTYFTGARLDSDSYWSYDNGNISYTNGNVGINTTSPSSTLEVVGTAEITGDMSVLGTRGSELVVGTSYGPVDTDGFVVFSGRVDGASGTCEVTAYADTSSTPTTARARQYSRNDGNYAGSMQMTVPVRKNEYFRITTTAGGCADTSGGGNPYINNRGYHFIPFGNSNSGIS